MNWFEALILGAVQGVTEFLPISSSGHLVIFESIFGLNIEGLKSFDVTVHVATLLAIIIYFKKDVLELIKAFLGFFRGKFSGEYQQLVMIIVIATIPAVIVGLLFADSIDFIFRNVMTIGVLFMLMSSVFILSEAFGSKYKKEKKINIWRGLLIGFAQAVALIPGVSRSGSTIAMGLFLGVSREKAARFSFLLGIPAIAGAGLLTGIKVMGSSNAGVELLPMIVAFISSFGFGILTIWGLMKFLKKNSLAWFGAYLLIAGTYIVWF